MSTLRTFSAKEREYHQYQARQDWLRCQRSDEAARQRDEEQRMRTAAEQEAASSARRAGAAAPWYPALM